MSLEGYKPVQQKPRAEGAPLTEPKKEETLAEKLSNTFEQKGISSKVIRLENGNEFKEAIILDRKDVTPEKMARVYRGVNHLDSSVLYQIPYAMRKEGLGGGPTVLEEVRVDVDELAKSPSYENLTKYASKARSKLSFEEGRRLDEKIAAIEERILEGNSTRKELMFTQIEHGGGMVADSDLTPYVSATFDPVEAAQYGKSAILVIDVPLSQIEDFGPDNTKETNLKGALDPKYITAVLPRNYQNSVDSNKLAAELGQALQKVNENTQVNVFTPEELHDARVLLDAEEGAKDNAQWETDVAQIRKNRTERLARRFKEVKLNLETTPENPDIYQKAKNDIFDFYKERMAKMGKNGRNVEEYDYRERESSISKKFDREKINDAMLFKLKELVEHLEDREAERQRLRR